MEDDEDGAETMKNILSCQILDGMFGRTGHRHLDARAPQGGSFATAIDVNRLDICSMNYSNPTNI